MQFCCAVETTSEELLEDCDCSDCESDEEMDYWIDRPDVEAELYSEWEELHAEFFLSPRYWQKKSSKTWAEWETALGRWYEKYAAYMLTLGGTFSTLDHSGFICLSPFGPADIIQSLLCFFLRVHIQMLALSTCVHLQFERA